MKLIVGLGNPGTNYQGTRHNIGFDLLEAYAQEKSFSFAKKSFKSLIAEAQIEGQRCLFALPQTYMNLSGEAVLEIVQFYKLDLSNLILVHDELDLEPAVLKLVRKGRPAGHRGVDSVQCCLGTQEISRFRVGIGRPQRSEQVVSYVLERFTKYELEEIEKIKKKFFKGLDLWISVGIEAALKFCHS
ncbi:MAG: aminoacyl-tRNA hydrolase [Deltaproteobacteria bacterium]|nr:aminoacyl-tRNA hydrolase [Deltaproteobacteria bacterium]